MNNAKQLLSSVIELKRLGFEASVSEEVNILGGKSVSYYNNIRTYNDAFAIISDSDGFLVLLDKHEQKFSSLSEATMHLATLLVKRYFLPIEEAKDLRCEYSYLPDEDGHCSNCGNDKDLFDDNGKVLCRKHVTYYVGGKEKLELSGQELPSE